MALMQYNNGPNARSTTQSSSKKISAGIHVGRKSNNNRMNDRSLRASRSKYIQVAKGMFETQGLSSYNSRKHSRCVLQITASSANQETTATDDTRRFVDQSQEITDPYSNVEDLMTACEADGSGCKAVFESTKVDDIVALLKTYTGLPVIDEDGKCIGVISDKDLSKLGRLGDESTVGEVMTSPAISIRPHAKVAYAAGIMLQNKIHRLPIVDKEGTLLGIVSRTDIFEPLLCVGPECESDPIYRQKPSYSGHGTDFGNKSDKMDI